MPIVNKMTETQYLRVMEKVQQDADDKWRNSCESQESKLVNEKKIPKQETESIVNKSRIEETETDFRPKPIEQTQQDESLKNTMEIYLPLIHTHNGKRLKF